MKIFFSILLSIYVCDIQAQSIDDLSLTEKLAYTTARIVVITNNQDTISGTGFYFQFEMDGFTFPVLVTNKHVLKDGIKGKFFMNVESADGSINTNTPVPVEFTNFDMSCVFHPDTLIDLAIVTIQPFITEAQKKNINLFYLPIIEDNIPSDSALNDLTSVEDILMIGYPIGIIDEYNNYPIFRRGITATHPKNNYNGREEFMIDAACFPGSSGSPIFIAQGSYYSKSGQLFVGTRFMFLGILYAGPTYSADGKISIVTIPEKNDIKIGTPMVINLGNVIKSKKLLDFKFILKQMLPKAK